MSENEEDEVINRFVEEERGQHFSFLKSIYNADGKSSPHFSSDSLRRHYPVAEDGHVIPEAQDKTIVD